MLRRPARAAVTALLLAVATPTSGEVASGPPSNLVGPPAAPRQAEPTSAAPGEFLFLVEARPGRTGGMRPPVSGSSQIIVTSRPPRDRIVLSPTASEGGCGTFPIAKGWGESALFAGDAQGVHVIVVDEDRGGGHVAYFIGGAPARGVRLSQATAVREGEGDDGRCQEGGIAYWKFRARQMQ